MEQRWDREDCIGVAVGYLIVLHILTHGVPSAVVSHPGWFQRPGHLTLERDI